MCLAIPAEVVQIEGEMATVRVGDALRKASLMLLPESARLGDYIIVHAGFALHKVDPQEARESLRLLRELASFVEQEDFIRESLSEPKTPSSPRDPEEA